jgi:hypothetical protein
MTFDFKMKPLNAAVSGLNGVSAETARDSFEKTLARSMVRGVVTEWDLRTSMVAIALAARIHNSRTKVKICVMRCLERTRDPQYRASLEMILESRDPLLMVEATLEFMGI